MHTPVSAGAALWPACLEVLAQELPEQQFNTWIKPLNAQLATDQSKLTLFVANRFKLDWVRAQYATRIAGILESLHGQPVSVELALAPRAALVKYTPQEIASSAGSPPPAVHEATPAPIPSEEESADGSGFRHRLNTALTFDTLVEG